MSEEFLNCKVCGKEPYIPEPVDGGGHIHHQAICNDCGIEVTRLNSIQCQVIWNRLMSGGCKKEQPSTVEEKTKEIIDSLTDRMHVSGLVEPGQSLGPIMHMLIQEIVRVLGKGDEK